MISRIQIINGPNLNLLGKREPSVYGDMPFETYFTNLQKKYSNVELLYFQNNTEGSIVDKLQEIGYTTDGIILNAGAYTHTSIAIRDTVAAITTEVVEVHISNIYAREHFRKQSYLSEVCKGSLCGFGLNGYEMALTFLLTKNKLL